MVKTFTECKEVVLEGVSLTVAHVAAVARRLEVRVVLDIAVAKTRVDKSSNWVLSKIMKGSDIYGVTTGFGATSHRRTRQGVELQKELIRCLVSWFLNLIQTPASHNGPNIRASVLCMNPLCFLWEKYC